MGFTDGHELGCNDSLGGDEGRHEGEGEDVLGSGRTSVTGAPREEISIPSSSTSLGGTSSWTVVLLS